MGFNLESRRSEVDESVSDDQITSEKLSETEDTAVDFEGCAATEVTDNTGDRVDAASLEDAEVDFENCAADMEQMEEEHPELAEDEDDLFRDCGSETEGHYVAEVTCVVDSEVSESEVEAAAQQAYNECDDPENMDQLKDNLNQNEHIEAVHAEVIERPENPPADEETQEKYEQAKQEYEQAEEKLEAQQEAAEQKQEELETEIKNEENTGDGAETIQPDLEQNPEETPELPQAENPEENPEQPPEENVESNPEEATELPPEQNTEGNPENTTELPPEENTESNPEETTELPPEENPEGNPEETTELPPEENTEGSPEEATELPPEQNTEGNPEKTTELPPEENTESNPEETSELPPEENTESIPEEAADQPPEENTESNPEEATELPPEENPESNPEEATELPPEENPESNPEETTELPPEENPESNPEETTELPPEENTEGNPEETAELPPDEDTECNPEETSELPPEDNTEAAALCPRCHQYPCACKVEEIDGANDDRNPESQEKLTVDDLIFGRREIPRLEDMSMAEINEFSKSEEGRAYLKSMHAEMVERVNAERMGVSPEEYKHYRNAMEQPREAPMPSDVQLQAAEVASHAEEVHKAFQAEYFSGAKKERLGDLNNQLSTEIPKLDMQLNALRQEQQLMNSQIMMMHSDRTFLTNPEKYRELCDRQKDLEADANRLSVQRAMIFDDMYACSLQTGKPYRHYGEEMSKEKFQSYTEEAQRILDNKVRNEKDIAHAMRVREGLRDHVLPELHEQRKEVESQISITESAQQRYLKEHGCTHEQAMKDTDSEYARNARYLTNLETEKAQIQEEFIRNDQLRERLGRDLPFGDQKCQVEIRDLENGTTEIRYVWKNRVVDTKGGKGNHSSETKSYLAGSERQETFILGRDDDAIYSYSYSQKFRGLSYEREDVFTKGENQLKNKFEAGLINLDGRIGYQRDINTGKRSISMEASGSLMEMKDSLSAVVKDKESKLVSAGVAFGKGETEFKVDEHGVKMKAPTPLMPNDPLMSTNLTIGLTEIGSNPAKERPDSIQKILNNDYNLHEKTEQLEKAAAGKWYENVEKAPDLVIADRDSTLAELTEKALNGEKLTAGELTALRTDNDRKIAQLQELKTQAEKESAEKFQKVFAMQRGTEEYRQALKDYNATFARKEELAQQYKAAQDQHELLEAKAAQFRADQVSRGEAAVAASAATLAGAKTLQERYDRQIYDRKPDKRELSAVAEGNAAAIAELNNQRDALRAAVDAKMDQIAAYVQSHNMDRGDTARDPVYQRMNREYLELQAAARQVDYTAVKLEENNKTIRELTGIEVSEKTAPKFGPYEVGEKGFVKGEHYDRFIQDWKGDSGESTVKVFDQPRIRTVSADLVEGISVSEYDIENPSVFWSQHESDGTAESFREIARQIPQVQTELNSGRPLADILQDPKLGTCASIYFDPSNIPEVIQCGDYYEFQSNGRHRILAAREVGHEMPVKVIGERTYLSDERCANEVSETEQPQARTLDKLNEQKNEVYRKVLIENGIVSDADFGSLDNRTVKDMAASVMETKEMFPELELRFIGSAQARNEAYAKDLEQSYLKAYRARYPDATEEDLLPVIRQQVQEDMQGMSIGENTIAQSLSAPGTTMASKYNGITINEKYGSDYDVFKKTKEADVQAGWKPVNCDTPKATMDHELGHQIAKLVKAHEDPQIKELYSLFAASESDQQSKILSGYAATNIHEFIAESWSEYRNNPQCRPCAKSVAERILTLYHQDPKEKVKSLRR